MIYTKKMKIIISFVKWIKNRGNFYGFETMHAFQLDDSEILLDFQFIIFVDFYCNKFLPQEFEHL